MKAVECGHNVIALINPRKENQQQFLHRAGKIADDLDVVGRRLDKLRRLQRKTNEEIEVLLKEHPDYA